MLILDHGKRSLGFLIGGVVGVEKLAPPAEGGAGLVRGVAAARSGAVTVLGAAALVEAAVALFGGR